MKSRRLILGMTLTLLVLASSGPAAARWERPTPGCCWGGGPAVPRSGQWRVRRPQVRPGPALRDRRPVAAGRRHRHHTGARDPGAVAVQPRFRRIRPRRRVGGWAQGRMEARGRGARDHALPAASQRRALLRPRRPVHRRPDGTPRRPRHERLLLRSEWLRDASAAQLRAPGVPVKRPPVRQGAVPDQLRCPRRDQGHRQRTARLALGAPGTRPLDIRPAPADGAGARPARGRRLRRERPGPAPRRPAPRRERAEPDRAHAAEIRPRAAPARLDGGAGRPLSLRRLRVARRGALALGRARDPDPLDL